MNPKNYPNNVKILNKQNKKYQIISMEAKLENFKEEPNKTYTQKIKDTKMIK